MALLQMIATILSITVGAYTLIRLARAARQSVKVKLWPMGTFYATEIWNGTDSPIVVSQVGFQTHGLPISPSDYLGIPWEPRVIDARKGAIVLEGPSATLAHNHVLFPYIRLDSGTIVRGSRLGTWWRMISCTDQEQQV